MSLNPLYPHPIHTTCESHERLPNIPSDIPLSTNKETIAWKERHGKGGIDLTLAHRASGRFRRTAARAWREEHDEQLRRSKQNEMLALVK